MSTLLPVYDASLRRMCALQLFRGLRPHVEDAVERLWEAAIHCVFVDIELILICAACRHVSEVLDISVCRHSRWTGAACHSYMSQLFRNAPSG